MIKIQTDFGEYRNIQGQIDKLIGIDKILRTVTNSARAEIIERIEQQGKKSDGSPIKTKSKKTFGAYSESWGKKRSEGTPKFQTNIIDLTFSGDTLSDFVAEPAGPNAYQVGFRSDKAGKIAQGHEEYFGEIFSPTPEEQKNIEEDIENAIDDLFK